MQESVLGFGREADSLRRWTPDAASIPVAESVKWARLFIVDKVLNVYHRYHMAVPEQDSSAIGNTETAEVRPSSWFYSYTSVRNLRYPCLIEARVQDDHDTQPEQGFLVLTDSTGSAPSDSVMVSDRMPSE